MTKTIISDQFKTAKKAIKVAKALRANGQNVKVYRHEGIYTQPGKGIVPYLYFTVS